MESTLPYLVNDADNHFVEPEDMFVRYIDPKWSKLSLSREFFMGRDARFGKLDRRPKEIFREHFVVAPFPEENVQRTLDEVGLEPIVFGSDFPHGEGLAFPAEYAEAQLGGMPEDHVRAIMRDNLARFLEIPT